MPHPAATGQPSLAATAVEDEPAPLGLRVLIVEDNEDGREILVALLGAMGFTVEGAPDGDRALARAAAFDPDVVLLDLGLPGLHGLDVARALRADDRTAQARIVALTGWGAARDRAQTSAAGFDDHLTKPVDPAMLHDYLVELGPRPGR